MKYSFSHTFAPHRLAFRGPDTLQPPLYQGMLTVSLREGPPTSSSPLCASSCAVGFFLLDTRGS